MRQAEREALNRRTDDALIWLREAAEDARDLCHGAPAGRRLVKVGDRDAELVEVLGALVEALADIG